VLVKSIKSVGIVLLVLLLTASSQQIFVLRQPLSVHMPVDNAGYLQHVSFNPAEAQYADLIQNAFDLNTDEKTLLEQNGFVVSDRLAFSDFTHAYAWIYWKDLPVLVTTDSILQAVHQSYDQLTTTIEYEMLLPRLTDILTGTRSWVKAQAASNTDTSLIPIYHDLDIYLTVPLSLLTATSYDTDGVEPYLDLAQNASDIAPINLFNSQYPVDFTQFKPRGHYTFAPQLEAYFRAISWLSHIDLRLVDYTPQGKPVLNTTALAAAEVLRDAVNRSGQRTTWADFDKLFTALIGKSDNTTLDDLDRFFSDAGISSPSDILKASASDDLLGLLTSGLYGVQKITGQVLAVAPDNPNPLPRPISFLLLGQRFAVDSYILSSVVYDRLMVDNHKVERGMPSPLDVMTALGNDRAQTLLSGELQQYGYGGVLSALRSQVNHLDSSFWSQSVYNRWLGALRDLNVATTDNTYPQTMRTAGWADKMLQTQLASWTQLRHDNILYVKLSFTMVNLCSYPAGYVEPYPQFYAAIGDYARSAQTLFDGITLRDEEQYLRDNTVRYFGQVASITDQLRTLAEKELRLEPFTLDEDTFLKSIVVHQWADSHSCSGPRYIEKWDGWYLDLFLNKDDSPALVADIHTNLEETMPPVGALHVGTGPVAALIFAVDTDEGVSLYAGPSFTYFEAVTPGNPPLRLTDEDWNKLLATEPRPPAPDWTASFRLWTPAVPANFLLPPSPEGTPAS
jgi:Protein of unknown function (DUF3160)